MRRNGVRVVRAGSAPRDVAMSWPPLSFANI
jgi:hypothetical protein